MAASSLDLTKHILENGCRGELDVGGVVWQGYICPCYICGTETTDAVIFGLTPDERYPYAVICNVCGSKWKDEDIESILRRCIVARVFGKLVHFHHMIDMKIVVPRSNGTTSDGIVHGIAISLERFACREKDDDYASYVYVSALFGGLTKSCSLKTYLQYDENKDVADEILKYVILENPFWNRTTIIRNDKKS